MPQPPSTPLRILWVARHATADHPVPALAQLFRAQGHQVDLVGWAEQSSGQQPGDDGPLLRTFTVRGAGDRREPIRVHVPSRKLLRLLRSSRADVVIHRDLGPLAAVVLLARLGSKGTPSLMLLEHQLDRAGPAATVWWKKILRSLLAKSPTIALANHRLAADQLRQLRVGQERIRTGWWLAGFDASKLSSPSPSPSRSTSTTTKLVIVGRLSRRKGVDFVLDAVADAVAAGADITLTIVGGGPEEAALRAQVDSASLDERVTFLGSVDHDELPHVLYRHDALVMGSFEDHTGRSAIEALSLGVPVLASSRSGIADILVEHNVNGLIIDPTDRTSFGRHLASLTPQRLEHLRSGAASTAPMLQPQAAASQVLAAATEAAESGRLPRSSAF